MLPPPVCAALNTVPVLFDLLLPSAETDACSQDNDLAKNHLGGNRDVQFINIDRPLSIW